MSKQIIKVAHSPDSDDAFMFYALKHKKINTKNYDFEISSAEIETLNQALIKDKNAYDICAVSFHAYYYLQNDFEIMHSGASMGGKDYGPKIIYKLDPSVSLQDDVNESLSQAVKSSSRRDPVRIQNNEQMFKKVAVPGKLTTAYLVARIYEQETSSGTAFEPRFCSYSEVFDLLDTGKVDASLLIHEAQLRYQELGYKLLVDLGAWWYEFTGGLNMPLGCNVVSKALGETTVSELNELLYQSIIWGKENFAEVMEYSRDFAKNNLDDDQAKKYLDMYVNDSTIKLSQNDYKSIHKVLEYAKKLSGLLIN